MKYINKIDHLYNKLISFSNFGLSGQFRVSYKQPPFYFPFRNQFPFRKFRNLDPISKRRERTYIPTHSINFKFNELKRKLNLDEIIYSTMKSMESDDLAILLTFLKLSIKLYHVSLSLSLSLSFYFSESSRREPVSAKLIHRNSRSNFVFQENRSGTALMPPCLQNLR